MSFDYRIIDNFLSEYQCLSLIEYFSDKLFKSNVIGDDSLRTSDDHYIQTNMIDDSIVLNEVKNLQKIFSEISNLPIENQELLTIIRYKVGQEFKPHFDTFREEDMEIQSVLGGQRIWTFITCLREAESGGETTFPNLNTELKLKTGQCIFWKNTDVDGNVFEESIHSGNPPVSGEKWIITCWIRENKYYPIEHNTIKNLLNIYTKDQLVEVLSKLS